MSFGGPTTLAVAGAVAVGGGIHHGILRSLRVFLVSLFAAKLGFDGAQSIQEVEFCSFCESSVCRETNFQLDQFCDTHCSGGDKKLGKGFFSTIGELKESLDTVQSSFALCEGRKSEQIARFAKAREVLVAKQMHVEERLREVAMARDLCRDYQISGKSSKNRSRGRSKESISVDTWFCCGAVLLSVASVMGGYIMGSHVSGKLVAIGPKTAMEDCSGSNLRGQSDAIEDARRKILFPGDSTVASPAEQILLDLADSPRKRRAATPAKTDVAATRYRAATIR